jgi:hypothetical protein
MTGSTSGRSVRWPNLAPTLSRAPLHLWAPVLRNRCAHRFQLASFDFGARVWPPKSNDGEMWRANRAGPLSRTASTSQAPHRAPCQSGQLAGELCESAGGSPGPRGSIQRADRMQFGASGSHANGVVWARALSARPIPLATERLPVRIVVLVGRARARSLTQLSRNTSLRRTGGGELSIAELRTHTHTKCAWERAHLLAGRPRVCDTR